MRNVKKNLKKAFTLVEILIVVVILGILAAIVIPQFTSATQDSQAGNIKAQLGTLQRQIELYFAKNNAYPAFATESWGAAGDVTSMIGGNFIKESPRNPAGSVLTTAQRDDISVVTGTTYGAAATGWVWNSTDSKIYASYFKDNPANVTDADFGTTYTGAFTAANE